MPASFLPNGLIGEFDDGETDWGGAMRHNLRQLSALNYMLFNNETTAGMNDPNAPPYAAVYDGSTYYIGSSPVGPWAGHPNEIAWYYGGQWHFFTPWTGLIGLFANGFGFEQRLYWGFNGWVAPVTSRVNQSISREYSGTPSAGDVLMRIAAPGPASKKWEINGLSEIIPFNRPSTDATISLAYQYGAGLYGALGTCTVTAAAGRNPLTMNTVGDEISGGMLLVLRYMSGGNDFGGLALALVLSDGGTFTAAFSTP